MEAYVVLLYPTAGALGSPTAKKKLRIVILGFDTS
jgi:hypothetical protein